MGVQSGQRPPPEAATESKIWRQIDPDGVYLFAVIDLTLLLAVGNVPQAHLEGGGRVRRWNRDLCRESHCTNRKVHWIDRGVGGGRRTLDSGFVPAGGHAGSKTRQAGTGYPLWIVTCLGPLPQRRSANAANITTVLMKFSGGTLDTAREELLTRSVVARPKVRYYSDVPRDCY
jgi:hypothetical protein